MFTSKSEKNKRAILLYSTLELLILFYGSECWTIRTEEKSRLPSAEMKFIKKQGVFRLTLKEILKLNEN